MHLKPLDYYSLSEAFNLLGEFYFPEKWTGKELENNYSPYDDFSYCTKPTPDDVDDPYTKMYTDEEWETLCEKFVKKNIPYLHYFGRTELRKKHPDMEGLGIDFEDGSKDSPYIPERKDIESLREWVDKILRSYAIKKAMIRLLYSGDIEAEILNKESGFKTRLLRPYWFEQPPPFSFEDSQGIIPSERIDKTKGTIYIPEKAMDEFIQALRDNMKEEEEYTTPAMILMNQTMTELNISRDNQPSHESVITLLESKGAEHGDAVHMARFMLLLTPPPAYAELGCSEREKRKEEIRESAIVLLTEHFGKSKAKPKKRPLVIAIHKQKPWGVSLETIERELNLDACISVAKSKMSK